MRKTILNLIFVFSSVLGSLGQAMQTQDIAKVRHVLSDYRDISFFARYKPGLARFTPDGKFVAVMGRNDDVVIYDVATGEVKSRILRSPVAFSFSRDSKFAVLQDQNGIAPIIFETNTGKIVRDPHLPDLPQHPVEQIDIRDRSLSINTSKLSYVEVLPIDISPDGKYLLGSSKGSEFSLYDFQLGKIHKELKHESFDKLKFIGKSVLLPVSQFSSYSFSQDGRILVIAKENESATLWETASGKLLTKFEDASSAYLVSVNPKGDLVAAATIKGHTQIYSVDNGRAACSIDPKQTKGKFILWNEIGDKFLFLHFDKGDILAFASKTCEKLYSFDGSNAIAAISSNNTKLIATLPRKSKQILFQIWELDTGRLVATVSRGRGSDEIQSLRWSPDDKMLLSASGLDNEVDLWDATGRHLQTLKNSRFPIQFSPDCRTLVTGGKSENGKTDAAYIWSLIDK